MAKPPEPWAPKERADVIMRLLQSRRTVKVTELCAILKVSEITIRRSLNEMAEKGLIMRVHGGAMLVDTGEDSRFFANRARQNQLVKRLLAAETVASLPPSGSLYLDSGSTCFEVAKALATSGKEYLVVTDSLLVLRELFGIPHLETMLLGGALAPDKVTMDGHLAVESAKRLSLDVCVFSANGFTVDEISNHYLSGVATKEMMIQRCKKSVCIIDSGKYNEQCRFHFCGWEDVDEMATDSGLPREAIRGIMAQNVEVRVAEADTDA